MWRQTASHLSGAAESRFMQTARQEKMWSEWLCVVCISKGMAPPVKAAENFVKGNVDIRATGALRIQLQGAHKSPVVASFPNVSNLKSNIQSTGQPAWALSIPKKNGKPIAIHARTVLSHWRSCLRARQRRRDNLSVANDKHGPTINT